MSTQLGGCLERIFIEKKRNVRGTCCEFFSHFVLVFLLVYGYSLSVVFDYPPKTYSDVVLSVPLNISGSAFQNLLEGPLVVPGFDTYTQVATLLKPQLEDAEGILSQTSYGQSLDIMLNRRVIHYAPRGQVVSDFIQYMNATYVSFKQFRHRIHDTEKDAEQYILDGKHTPFALIVFREISPGKVNYVVRQQHSALPSTKQISISPTVGLNNGYVQYLLSGFLTLKKSIDIWAFNVTGATNSTVEGHCSGGPPDPVLTPFPTFAYDQNPFYTTVGFLLGLTMIMSTMYPMSKLAKSIVEEKELRMRELMKIMGLSDWAHQLSWFLSAFVLFFWIAVTMTLVTRSSFIQASSPGIIFLYFFFFAMSEITLSFLVSVFFSNSKLAAIAAPVVIFATILPRYIFYTVPDNAQVGNKILACLLSPTAFAFAADFLSQYEYAGQGIQSSNLFEGEFNFGTCLVMLVVDFVLYGFLAWYFDQVIPQEHGTPKHPLFIFSVRYWFPCFCAGKLADRQGLDFEDMEEFRDGNQNDRIEHLPREMLPQGTVRIKHLAKTYPDGKVAVREFSLTMLEGQITCLLGHNGAGKSTTISCLTGMVEATSGDVCINGYFLGKELQAIRQLTGLCPQHNVLYPNLTVYEHLRFFGLLKGLHGSTLRQRISYIIEEVGLTEKRNVRSHALSGGMKRKLCLGMALVGDPKFVLLDEPTSGMDPYSRRSTWELLQKHKAGRVILLTTHFMDEADTLADRIAIMSEGVLLCSGSSLFLKNRFGAGYLLSCSKVSSDSPVHAIEAEVQAIVPSASILSAVAGEVILQMPLSSAQWFPRLFKTLEERKEKIGVKSFGISITTLEQVFIALAHAKDPHIPDVPETPSIWAKIRNLVRIYPCDRQGAQAQALRPDHAPLQLMEACAPAAVMLPGDMGESDEGKASEHEVEEGIRKVPAPHGEYELLTLSPSNVGAHDAEDRVAMKHIDDSGIGKIRVWNQVVELYRKRLIIASRDWKGFFFQIVFPAIQILLILLILNVTINPAGPTIILKGDVFDRYGRLKDPAGLVANADMNAFSPSLQGRFARQDLANRTFENRWNSSSVSQYLLDQTQFVDQRFGVVVFRDVIPVDVTVDWQWVRSTLSSVDNLGNVTNDILIGLFGEDYHYTIDATSPLLANFNLSSLFNTTAGLAQLRNGLNLTALVNSLPQNSTQLPSFLSNSTNSALQNFLSNLTSSALNTLIQNAQNNASQVFSASSITVDSSGVTVIIDTNITGLPDLTQTIPWSDITYDTIEPFLPESTQFYNITVPSAYTVMHNSTSPHAAAAWHGELTEAAFQTCMADPEAQYLTKNHPLPITTDQSLQIKIILSLLTSIFILVPLCYIPAAFVSFLVKERVSKSKHLQQASGVSPYLYWASAYLWDMSLFTILTGFILIAFYIVGKSSSSVFVGSAESNLAVLVLVMSYGAGAIPLNYLYSFAFSNHSTAQISITLVNFMTGFVLVLAYYVMSSIPETKAAAEVMVHIFRIFPAYNIGEGFINLSTNYYESTILGSSAGPFDWLVCGRSMVFMVVEAIGYMMAVMLSESRLLKHYLGVLEAHRAQQFGAPPAPKNAKDDDVLLEEEETRKLMELMRVQASPAGRHPGAGKDSGVSDLESPSPIGGVGDQLSSLALLVDGLIKTYVGLDPWSKPKYAVRGLSLACRDGERFGLLGINGAGKTTTLGILTGELDLTSGSVLIGGRPLSDGLTQRMLGYCPQVDPLLDLMTGYETLRFFGRIRGLDEALLEKRVQALVRQTGLQPHAHRPCGTYSGGNKRKLSLAVALIGDPKVLLLDEPSTGMDPEARRHMWDVIEQVSSQRTVVLVSHSMEEIEALCTRVGVMVSGRMQCLGSVQHLKSKFGGAYTVELRCAVERVEECLRLCRDALPDCVVEEQHGGFFRLRVDRDIDLAGIFALLEGGKATMGIHDYSVSQCSLEQVFIKFAKEQEEEPAAAEEAVAQVQLLVQADGHAAGAVSGGESALELSSIPPADVVEEL